MALEEFETTQEQTEPSYNPVAEESSAVAFEYVADNLLKQTNTCIPAIVEEYDREKNVVTVQPAISEAIAGGKYIERAQLKVPVFQPAGGGFVLSFPLQKGDTGWLIACDRDISLFKQQKTKINPNTYRTHSFEDSFFIPDFVNGFKPDKDMKDCLVLSRVDKTSKLIIGKDSINLLSGTAQTELKSLASKIKEISIEGSTIKIQMEKIEITADIAIKGNVEIDGDLKANNVKSSSVSADSVEASGISLSSHVHGGVEAGGSTTGGPE